MAEHGFVAVSHHYLSNWEVIGQHFSCSLMKLFHPVTFDSAKAKVKKQLLSSFSFPQRR